MFLRLWEKEVVKVLFPSLIAVLLFVVTFSQIILPSFRENLFEKKKESIHEVTEVAFDILTYYQQLEESGQLDQNQAQNAAMQQIKNLRYGKDKKDYFWINDMNLSMIMHPYRSDLDGKDMSNFVDPLGKKLFVDLVSTVQAHESGYVDYMWQWKDDPSLIVPKLSFVKAFAPWNWVIGTGVYVDDVDNEIRLLTRKMILYTTVILGLICLLSFYIIRQSLAAVRRRQHVEAQLRKHKIHLEELVNARTSELVKSNKNLEREISQRKIADTKIRQQHEFLYSVIEAIPYPFSVIDAADYSILFANKASRDFARISADYCYLMLHNRQEPCKESNHLCPVKEVKSKKESIVIEHTHIDRNEIPVLLELHCHPIFDENGDVTKVIESSIDITERRRMEKSLLQSEQKFRNLIETANDAIFVSDLISESIVQVNKSAETMLGLPADEILKHKLSKLLFPKDKYADYRKRFLTHCLEGKGFLAGVAVRHQDGRDIPVEISVSFADWGRQQVVQSIFRDITEREIMERNLCQAHKMKAVGTLAGSIAHDFNNILQAIIGFAEISLLSVDGKSDTAKYLQNIFQAGRRGRDLVSQILTFSKSPVGEERSGRIYLQKPVGEALGFLKSTLPSTVEIHQQINENCRPVHAGYIKIQQIVLNLCTNANHAMSEKGGGLSVSLYEKFLSKEDKEQFPDLSQGWHVALSVKDTGCGMSANTLNHIFDPYFTTKKNGEGTGLGLASVLGIVKSYKGSICVSSEYGKGSLFQLLFPVADGKDSVDRVEGGSGCASVPQLSKNVLFVDDESMIVELGKLYLDEAGCSVTACNSSLKAYDLFKASPDWFDVVITDQTMPAMTGMELSQKILEIRPDIPIVLTTGYSEFVDEEVAKAAGIKEFLMKPLTIASLIQTIKRIISQE